MGLCRRYKAVMDAAVMQALWNPYLTGEGPGRSFYRNCTWILHKSEKLVSFLEGNWLPIFLNLLCPNAFTVCIYIGSSWLLQSTCTVTSWVPKRESGVNSLAKAVLYSTNHSSILFTIQLEKLGGQFCFRRINFQLSWNLWSSYGRTVCRFEKTPWKFLVNIKIQVGKIM